MRQGFTLISSGQLRAGLRKVAHAAKAVSNSNKLITWSPYWGVQILYGVLRMAGTTTGFRLHYDKLDESKQKKAGKDEAPDFCFPGGNQVEAPTVNKAPGHWFCFFVDNATEDEKKAEQDKRKTAKKEEEDKDPVKLDLNAPPPRRTHANTLLRRMLVLTALRSKTWKQTVRRLGWSILKAGVFKYEKIQPNVAPSPSEELFVKLHVYVNMGKSSKPDNVLSKRKGADKKKAEGKGWKEPKRKDYAHEHFNSAMIWIRLKEPKKEKIVAKGPPSVDKVRVYLDGDRMVVD